MEKLRLELESLEIESFAASGTADAPGTVVAHGPGGFASRDGTCIQETCIQDCYWTIWETCGPSCLEGTCLDPTCSIC